MPSSPSHLCQEGIANFNNEQPVIEKIPVKPSSTNSYSYVKSTMSQYYSLQHSILDIFVVLWLLCTAFKLTLQISSCPHVLSHFLQSSLGQLQLLLPLLWSLATQYRSLEDKQQNQQRVTTVSIFSPVLSEEFQQNFFMMIKKDILLLF